MPAQFHEERHNHSPLLEWANREQLVCCQHYIVDDATVRCYRSPMGLHSTTVKPPAVQLIPQSWNTWIPLCSYPHPIHLRLSSLSTSHINIQYIFRTINFDRNKFRSSLSQCEHEGKTQMKRQKMLDNLRAVEFHTCGSLIYFVV